MLVALSASVALTLPPCPATTGHPLRSRGGSSTRRSPPRLSPSCEVGHRGGAAQRSRAASGLFNQHVYSFFRFGPQRARVPAPRKRCGGRAGQGQGASSGGRWSRRPLSHAIARRSKLSVHTPSPPPRCRPAFARGAERERERGRGGWGRERERERLS